MTRKDQIREMERYHLAGVVNTFGNGIKVERRLSTDGTTWERKTYSESLMDSGWSKTRVRFMTPEAWLEVHKDWQRTMTPELRRKDDLQRCLLALPFLILAVVFWKVVLIMALLAIAAPVILVLAILGRRPSYNAQRGWTRLDNY